MNAIKITKVVGGKAMRTSSMIGNMLNFPRLNKSLGVLGTSLTEGGTGRLLTTSYIVEMETLPNTRALLLTTETGSQYMIEPH